MKFIIGIIIGILVIIFMVQNVEVVDIQFLPWTIHLPRAIMILIVFVLGVGVGYVARGIRRRKKEKKEELETLKESVKDARR
jgi:putative membrane protein